MYLVTFTEKAQLHRTGFADSIANNDINQSREESSTTNICTPLLHSNNLVQISSQGNNNIACVQTIPRISNLISTR